MPKITNNRGAVLLLVLVIILTISIIGAILTALFFNVLKLSEIELDRTRALYFAESGIAMAMAALKNRAGEVNTAGSAAQFDSGVAAQDGRIIPLTELKGGCFEVYNDYSQSTIISIGKSNGIKRVIQVKYNAL